MAEMFFKRVYEPTATTLYLRLSKASNIEKVRLYFQKTNAKYKLRLKLFKVDRIGEKTFRKSLVYHRIWEEHLLLELGTYAFTPES